MNHLALKSNPWAPVCKTNRHQNGLRNVTLKIFKALPKEERCQNCEKMVRKIFPNVTLA